ncbi:MAG TPA: lysophospholipid acyltransferase family protein [Anaerolineae bacterium]|nr:lysophospholipid acyltransferase family protein [Anaerolineae bacterium]HQI84630.1 lysophospholipid acyltransferase family protein [Anaerolineae bacterium]
MIRGVLYTVGRILIALYARFFLELEILWQAPLPAGPKLIVANHPSFTDPFVLSLLSSRPMAILITSIAFLVPILGLYLKRSRHIPVVEGAGRLAFDEALQRLKAGDTVALFIEGQNSPPEGGFCAPRTGAVRLALSAGVPIIPVGIQLVRERLHIMEAKIKGQTYPEYWYLRGPFRMVVGEPIHLEGDIEDHPRVKAETQRIMQRIGDLVREGERQLQESALQRKKRQRAAHEAN